MNASRVHAVIAAGLANPQLLARWRKDPELLRDCGVDPDKLDLNALWKFAGLTAKIRHNGLRADLPLTFRLLNVAGLEIEIFASYASFCSSRGGGFADTTEDRMRELLSFLENRLDFQKLEHALLWDVIRHEVAITKLSTLARATSIATAVVKPRPGSCRITSVPSVCGEVILHEMRSDPRIVAAILSEKTPILDQIRLDPYHFCYWRSEGSSEIHILELDALGFYLVKLADGMRSIAELSVLMGGKSKPAKGFVKAVGDLAALGILRLRPVRDSDK
jgi:hypothetical protein